MLLLRGRPKYQYPKVAAVEVGNQRLQAATAAWNGLEFKQVQLWRDYADTLTKTEPITGKRYSPTAKNAFIGLAIKFLQINPGGTVPTTPPASTLTFDNLVLGIDNHPGGVRLAASAPNSAGIATEILVQKLVNERRSPTKFYKSLLFHTFTASGLVLDLALDPGTYAFAYRFVRPTTGQATSELLLGVVIVNEYRPHQNHPPVDLADGNIVHAGRTFSPPFGNPQWPARGAGLHLVCARPRVHM